MIETIVVTGAVVLLVLVLCGLFRARKTIDRFLVRDTVDINLPVRAVFDKFTEIENFPQLMEGVLEVRAIAHQRWQWRAEVLGRVVEREIAIEQIPDSSIAWKCFSVPPSSVKATFHKLSRSRTRVDVEVRAVFGDGEADQALIDHIKTTLRTSLRHCKSRFEERGIGRGDYSPTRRRRSS